MILQHGEADYAEHDNEGKTAEGAAFLSGEAEGH